MKTIIPFLIFVLFTIVGTSSRASSEPTLLDVVTTALGKGPDRDVLAKEIVKAVRADGENPPLTGSHAEDAALLGIYSKHESGANIAPQPWSWDARAGVSCGYLQLPCNVVQHVSLADQARLWLKWARQGGLAALDSSPTRAEQRRQEARAVLSAALAR
jgi:hypothetical protein